jgi:eukaryotic-like serine/threonine-protein kinase
MEMAQALCPECGSPLPAGATEGSCSTCLLMLGVAVPVVEVAPVDPETPAPGQSPEDCTRTEQSGQRIGRYKLLEKIGEGGFGTVWMAEQQEPVRRKVALKIIKLGMDTKQVVARFEAERQALAMMDHPNIARVFDGGATENGRPFFVMELVRGIPLTTYCDTARLATRERLELFIQVCQAVQHAHQKGIIHRDLKPTNILVTEQDGRAIPKVIDFGIAKATEQKLTELTLFTRFNQMIGTPAYMSPEQAGLGSLDIDTRSDIYSLGVLLYELLTGRTPLDPQKLREAGYDAILKTIREAEPPKPSTCLSTLKLEDLTAIAGLRREDPQKLHRLIRGDLDWITLKALEKDRGRRYQSAGDFARDVQRYLDNEVIQARPPSAVYRFQKAWRRNKLVFTAATAVTASLLIGLVVSTWLFAREKQSAAVLRQSAYASEMNVAFRAWQDGRVVRARALLEKQRPHSGETDLRGFEWRYLWKHSRANELFTLTNAATWGLALSPDGQTVAGCAGGQVRLWNVNTRQLISVLDPDAGWLFSLAFSPDGRTLATAHDNKHKYCVKLWDVATRNQIGQLDTKDTNAPLIGVAFSPDGKTIVTTYGGMYQYDAKSNAVGKVVLWDTATRQEIRQLIGSRYWVYQAAFSPDGETLAASDGDGAVNLWKVATGEMITRLSGHNGFVEPVTFSRDGEVLAAGDQQGHVWLWHWRSRRVESVFRAHDLPIYTILFSPDEQRLITASRDHTARMWDRQTRREIARFAGHTGGVTAAQLFPDGQTLVTSSQDGSLKFWDTRNRFPDDVLGAHTEFEVDITFTSNGRFLARAERKKTNITFFATDTGAPVQVLSGQGVAASQDGKLLSLVRDSKLIFLDPVTLVETRSMEAGAPLGSLAVSPDGKLIAIRRRDSAATNVVIIDPEQHREVKVFPTPDDEWAPLLFARQGTLLLTAGKTDNAISAWDTGSWRKIGVFQGIEWSDLRSVAPISVSPDGETIAARGKVGFVLVWNVDRPSNPVELNTGAGGTYSLAFSPDGKTLAIGSIDTTLRLWNVAARQEVAAFVGHSSYVNSTAFAPDGRTLASVSFDKTLRIWRAPSFEEIAAAEKDRTRTPQP